MAGIRPPTGDIYLLFHNLLVKIVVRKTIHCVSEQVLSRKEFSKRIALGFFLQFFRSTVRYPQTDPQVSVRTTQLACRLSADVRKVLLYLCEARSCVDVGAVAKRKIVEVRVKHFGTNLRAKRKMKFEFWKLRGSQK